MIKILVVYLLFFRNNKIPEKYNKAIWFILFSIPFTYSIKIADYFDALLWYITKKVTQILPTGDFPSIYDCSNYLGIESTYILTKPEQLDACFYFLPTSENEMIFMISRFMSSAAFLLLLYFFKFKKDTKK